MTNGGAVIWFTGLSGAGKSTVAQQVAQRLSASGERTELLDGDVVRTHFPGTGFDRDAREAHIRRVGFLASRLEAHGVVTVVALISPYAESRAFVRGLCEHFIEVHVATPLAVCEGRDVKGLYARARLGTLTDFTGIDAPYEAPLQPEVSIDTSEMTVEEAADLVLLALDRSRQRDAGA